MTPINYFKVLLFFIKMNELEEDVQPTESCAYKLFSHTANFNKLKFTRESLRSVTPYKLAKSMARSIIDTYYMLYGTQPRAIIDATANIGGNSLAFSSYFQRVLAFEIKKTTAQYLQNNIATFKVTNINVICGDFIKYIHMVKMYDIVFIDPPWFIEGEQNTKLALSFKREDYPISLEEVLIRIRCYKKLMVVVKVPLYYVCRITPFHRINYRKMSMLIFKLV